MLSQLVGEDLKAMLERGVLALEKLADAQAHQAFHECPSRPVTRSGNCTWESV